MPAPAMYPRPVKAVGRTLFCRPLRFVRTATAFFVLAAEEQNTILGLQNVLVRLPVTVLEEGDTTTAVSGALDYDTQVVVSSDKSVQAGDKVRIRDNT